MMVGNDPNSHLWSHFSLLRQTGMATVPSTYTLKTSRTDSVTESVALSNVKPAAKRTLDAVSSTPPVKVLPKMLPSNYRMFVHHGSKTAVPVYQGQQQAKQGQPQAPQGQQMEQQLAT